MTENDLLEKAVSLYGHDFQIEKTKEECAELIQALSKLSTKGKIKTVTDNLVEELVDVEIQLQLMKLVLVDLNLTEQYVAAKQKKYRRLQRRVDEKSEDDSVG